MMEIYPRYVQPMSLTVFEEVAKFRRGPVPDKRKRPASLPGRIWWNECWNKEVQNARD